MDELRSLDREIRQCSRCSAILNRHPENPPYSHELVEPKPVLSEPIPAQVMLIGQAPGLTEYQTGRPFAGQAGGGIRRLFAECGLASDHFDRIVYQTSAVKCFPGRKQSKDRWEDRVPCAAMRNSCSTFLRRQIDVVEPKIIVTLGIVAAQALDMIRGVNRRRMLDVLGTSDLWQQKTIVYLAHTSGGSRFLNLPANRAKQDRAKAILSSEFARLKMGAS